jgi:hypothetical protein
MAEPPLPEDLRDAPAEVQKSARWLEKNKRRGRLFSFSLLALALATLIGTSVGHDVLGWSELQSLAAFGSGLLPLIGVAVYGLTSSLRHGPLHASAVARFRELQRLGLLPSPVAAPTGTGVDRLVERIVALGLSTPGLVQAATQARDRASSLTAELAHLEQTMQADPDLRFRLSGVQERIQGEIAELRARLAETYATLVELDAADQDRAALPDAIERLRAELEVSSPEGRLAAAARRSQALSRATGG